MIILWVCTVKPMRDSVSVIVAMREPCLDGMHCCPKDLDNNVAGWFGNPVQSLTRHKDDRRNNHQDGRQTESQRIAALLPIAVHIRSQQGRDKHGQDTPSIDGKVEHCEEEGNSLHLIAEELVTTKGRHTRLDTPCAQGQQSQAEEAAPWSRRSSRYTRERRAGQNYTAEAIHNRQPQDRPILAQQTVRENTAYRIALAYIASNL